jgi:hypothetical protein
MSETNPQLKATFAYDEDGGTLCGVKFNVANSGITADVYMDIGTHVGWVGLYNAIEAKKGYRLETSECNGATAVSFDEQNARVVFELSKYGTNGGDGAMTISLERDVCLTAFRAIAAALTA